MGMGHNSPLSLLHTLSYFKSQASPPLICVVRSLVGNEHPGFQGSGRATKIARNA